MNMKVRKSVIAFLMATTMVGKHSSTGYGRYSNCKSVYKDNWFNRKNSASPDIVPEKLLQ